MNALSKEQLQSLTDMIIDRLQEFDIPATQLPNRGMVRVAYEVITAFYQGGAVLSSTPAPEQPATPLHATHKAAQPRSLPDPDVAREKLADALAQGACGSLLALEIRTPRTLEEVDADPDAQRRAEFDAVVSELQRMAMGGIMPRMSTWDAVKPTHMPASKTIINTYRVGWRQLAEVADLKMDRKGGAEMEPVYRNGVK